MKDGSELLQSKLSSSPSPISSSISSTASRRRPVVAGKSKTRVNIDGVKLEDMLIYLVGAVGYDGMFLRTKLRAFDNNPSIKSSLKVLRNKDNLWARSLVEEMYVEEMRIDQKFLEDLE